MEEENQNLGMRVGDLTPTSLQERTQRFLNFASQARENRNNEASAITAANREATYEVGLNSKNHGVTEGCNATVRLGQVADWINDYWYEGKMADAVQNDTVNFVQSYLDNNEDNGLGEAAYNYIVDENNWDCDPTELYNKLGWPTNRGANTTNAEAKSSSQSDGISLRNPVTKVGAVGVGAEFAGRGLETWGKNIQKDALGETNKDIDREIKYSKAQETYELYDNKIKNINKQINELAKSGGDEEEFAKLQEERERLVKLREQANVKNEPTLTADVGEEFDLKGGNKDISASAGANKQFLWTEEVQPYMDSSQAEFKYSDFLDDLKYEDFNVTEYDRKDYQNVIDDMKETYKDKPPMSTSELHAEKMKVGLSNKALQGQEAKAVQRDIQDKLYTKMNKAIKNTLEKENPGMGLAEKYEKYGLLDEIEEGTKKAAKVINAAESKPAKMPATKQELVLQVADKARKSKSFKTRAGSIMKSIGKYIKPSTYLSMGKDFLVNTFGADAAKVDTAIKGLGKAEKLTGKGFSKVLGALGDLAEPLVVLDTGVKLKKYEDIIDVLPMMQAKVQWTKGGKGYEDAEWYGWTEEDWDKIGLGKDDVAEILNSEEFENFLSSITWGGSNRDFVRNSYAPLLQ